jgi:hypothetical protein
VAGLYHLDCVCLERIEESRGVDCCVDNGPAWGVGRRLDVWMQESEGWRRLAREDGEEREELRCAMVWQVGQCEAFGVVLVYSEFLLVFLWDIGRIESPWPCASKRVRLHIKKYIPEPPD